MKEKIKGIGIGASLLLGFLLMMGAEGGMVAETLTEGKGVLLMFIGLGLILVPLLVLKFTEKGEEYESIAEQKASHSVVSVRGQTDR